MDYVVCLDLGAFDIPFFGCVTEFAANRYMDNLQPLCTYELKILPPYEIRELEETFINDICTRIDIVKKKYL